MSLDAKKELSAALIKNNELKRLVTGGFIILWPMMWPHSPGLYFQRLQIGIRSTETTIRQRSEVRFQLSIFSKADTRKDETEIAKEIDRLMKDLGYGRYDSVDLYETDTKIFHRGMRYVKTFF